jgi:hypothetical protein
MENRNGQTTCERNTVAENRPAAPGTESTATEIYASRLPFSGRLLDRSSPSQILLLLDALRLKWLKKVSSASQDVTSSISRNMNVKTPVRVLVYILRLQVRCVC